MLDREGFRPNVGIILVNARNEVFWGKRIREHSWQFPQGGIKHGESPEQAMYRELFEEVGLRPEHVKILGRTRGWLRRGRRRRSGRSPMKGKPGRNPSMYTRYSVPLCRAITSASWMPRLCATSARSGAASPS